MAKKKLAADRYFYKIMDAEGTALNTNKYSGPYTKRRMSKVWSAASGLFQWIRSSINAYSPTSKSSIQVLGDLKGRSIVIYQLVEVGRVNLDDVPLEPFEDVDAGWRGTDYDAAKRNQERLDQWCASLNEKLKAVTDDLDKHDVTFTIQKS